MKTCPQCIGIRDDNGNLRSTIGVNKKEGIYYCKVCSRSWKIEDVRKVEHEIVMEVIENAQRHPAPEA